jgi:hypothetical protein
MISLTGPARWRLFVMKLLVGGLLVAALSPCGAQSNRLAIRFQPESDRFAEAAREYEVLWTREGERITAAMEAASGLKFEDREVRAIVREAASYRGERTHLGRSIPVQQTAAARQHLPDAIELDCIAHQILPAELH